MPLEDVWIWAFCLNAVLIAVSQRFLPLLTPAGWFHAGVLGTILWGCLGWRGWLSVVLYLMLGTLVTRLGFKRKLEAGLAESRGGRRGPENLWGSAATGSILAILIQLEIGLKELLLAGFAASFAAKLADTFGSEIGKRWGRRTILITSLRSVPPGTDGAISLEGTLASLLGSFFMTAVVVGLFFSEIKEFTLVIFVVGFLATLVESVVGAVLQHRLNWLTNELVNALQTSIAALLAITLGKLI